MALTEVAHIVRLNAVLAGSVVSPGSKQGTVRYSANLKSLRCLVCCCCCACFSLDIAHMCKGTLKPGTAIMDLYGQ